jgi:uncharacterized protein (TIGR02118 family)
MFKLISTFGLKPGYDPEETFKLWKREHVPMIKKLMHPELKGYVIGRVVHSPGKGEKFFGSVQLSYSSQEDAMKAVNKLTSLQPDEFMKRMADVRRVIIEEEDMMR